MRKIKEDPALESAIEDRKNRYPLPYYLKPLYDLRRQLPKQRIEAEEIKPDMRDSIRDKWWYSENLRKANIPNKELNLMLNEALLAVGGWETELCEIDDDLKLIIDFGYYFKMNAKVVKCKKSNSIRNCAIIWESNHENAELCMCEGYGMDDNGIWHRHSWIMLPYIAQGAKYKEKEKIIETTTTKYKAYFGVVLTEEEALEKVATWKSSNPEEAKLVEAKLEKRREKQEKRRIKGEIASKDYIEMMEKRRAEFPERMRIAQEWWDEKDRQFKEMTKDWL